MTKLEDKIDRLKEPATDEEIKTFFDDSPHPVYTLLRGQYEKSKGPNQRMRQTLKRYNESVTDETGLDDGSTPKPIKSYDAYVLAGRFRNVLSECEEGGNLHILISDANVEDEWIPGLIEQAETHAEKSCIELAADLSPGERWAAWLIVNGREKELWP